MEFDDHGIHDGIWSGVLSATHAPRRVVVTRQAQVMARATIAPLDHGRWTIRAELPGMLIADGLHSLTLIADQWDDDRPPGIDGQILARSGLVAGAVLADDLLAEIADLRAELELLKREFRRFASAG